ncbi:uncharacterized protein PAC_14621 [Phialocephala subalpina]|uniref:Uncharacterized protein n=1 Tax=Phialocephala subalpina TaxID=576137 RepID=A0A1L7XI63_9HELO|nr:uncharacterized protein PAC_14621 [Phialocephala subalpina]
MTDFSLDILLRKLTSSTTQLLEASDLDSSTALQTLLAYWIHDTHSSSLDISPCFTLQTLTFRLSNMTDFSLDILLRKLTSSTTQLLEASDLDSSTALQTLLAYWIHDTHCASFWHGLPSRRRESGVEANSHRSNLFSDIARLWLNIMHRTTALTYPNSNIIETETRLTEIQPIPATISRDSSSSTDRDLKSKRHLRRRIWSVSWWRKLWRSSSLIFAMSIRRVSSTCAMCQHDVWAVKSRDGSLAVWRRWRSRAVNDDENKDFPSLGDHDVTAN